MTARYPMLDPDGSLLPRHLARLRDTLEELDEETCEAAARALATAAADFVADAVAAACATASNRSPLEPWVRRRRAAGKSVLDPFDQEYRDELEDSAGVWYDDQPARPRADHAGQPAALGGLSVGLALGLRVAAWWLRRRPEPRLLVALTLGAATTVVAVAAGPPAVAGLTVAEWLLSLASRRTDRARVGSRYRG